MDRVAEIRLNSDTSQPMGNSLSEKECDISVKTIVFLWDFSGWGARFLWSDLPLKIIL